LQNVTCPDVTGGCPGTTGVTVAVSVIAVPAVTLPCDTLKVVRVALFVPCALGNPEETYKNKIKIAANTLALDIAVGTCSEQNSQCGQHQMKRLLEEVFRSY
jgi:hypothetical protein